MATADELKTFLAKRGYDVSVTKNQETYVVSINSKTVEEVSNLLVSIGEPGRFVVAVKLDDIIPTIGEILGVVKLKEDVSKLEVDMHGNVRKLTNTDAENKRQSEESLLSLSNKIDALNQTNQELVADMSIIKNQPWWKRFLGVK